MPELIATTTFGPVRGEPIAEGDGAVFRGVPFAAPPTGARRYLPPAPPTPWTDVRACTTFGPICPQLQLGAMGGVLAALGSGEPMDEDCLYLNVWTPALDDVRRPTMVFIHGGAFRGGSGSTLLYDGAAFARDDAVLVTLNYRLHALGFLALEGLFEGAEATGNLGILDQIAALGWVRDNIAAFGGDPDNVTIFGESAGAMSVGTLLGTPAADGLYRRAILESGASHHNLPATAARRVAERTLELIEVDPGDWDGLRAVPVDRIVAAANQIAMLEAAPVLGGDVRLRMPYMPVVDGTARDAAPIELVARGRARSVDILVGTNAEEWRLFVWGLPEAMRAAIPPPDITSHFAASGRASDDVLKVYAEARPGADQLDLLCAVESDQVFGIPAVRLAEAQLPHNPNVWMYRFSWRTPVLEGSLGACHALELPFVFETLDFARDLVGDSPPTDLARDVHLAWVQFARTGSLDWPCYDLDRRAVMDFGDERRVLDDPLPAERELWDGIW
jgi:para-nitrobenzyl esterase